MSRPYRTLFKPMVGGIAKLNTSSCSASDEERDVLTQVSVGEVEPGSGHQGA